MEEHGTNDQKVTANLYFSLLAFIRDTENRLCWSGLIFMVLETVIAIFVFQYIPVYLHITTYQLTSLEFVFLFFSMVIGVAIAAYWAAYATRLQLKLKLRFFQARYLERKMQVDGVHFLSDESLYFDRQVKEIESPDQVEKIAYPRSGLFRMDGFIGAARPYKFSLMMPGLFFLLFSTIFIWMLVQFIL